MYRQLFVLVEGSDDERFFEKVVKPLLKCKYSDLRIIQYAKRKKDYVNRLIESIKSPNWASDYIFVSDLNAVVCVTAKKQKLQEDFKEIEADKILIVKREIEAWYLGLLDSKACKEYRIPEYENTDHITKEDFKRLILRRFDGSEISFMQDILNNHSDADCIETAKQKNSSFRYFFDKYIGNE